MYKLHYDVDAGKKVNVVYKGMEIEVQAGEGSGTSYPIENPVWISNSSAIQVDVSRESMYMALQDGSCFLMYDEHSSLSFDGSVAIRRLNDNINLTVEVPILYIPQPLFLDIDCTTLYFYGGDQSENPIAYCKVKGQVNINDDLTIGSNMNQHSEYEFYGELILNADLTLNGCDVYLYTDELEDYGNHIYDGTNGGIVHVLTTYSGSTFGGHAVIKDLIPPDETN